MDPLVQANEYVKLLLNLRSVSGLILPAELSEPDEAAIHGVPEGDPEEWVTQVRQDFAVETEDAPGNAVTRRTACSRMCYLPAGQVP